MSERVPAGAFPESARAEQEIARKVLGSNRRAFDSRSKSLAEMRTAVNEHEQRIAALEGGGNLAGIEAKLEDLLGRAW